MNNEELKELVNNSKLEKDDKDFFIENIKTMSDFQKKKLEEIVHDINK